MVREHTIHNLTCFGAYIYKYSTGTLHRNLHHSVMTTTRVVYFIQIQILYAAGQHGKTALTKAIAEKQNKTNQQTKQQQKTERKKRRRKKGKKKERKKCM